MRHPFTQSRKALLAILAGVLVGGAALVGAHSSSSSAWCHEHTNQNANLCAYECALKGHDNSDFDPCNGKCKCQG